MSLRARQLLLLLQPTARASEWLAPVAGAVLAVAVDRLAGGISASLGLELAAIALALGASFALDDPAAESLGASPLPLVLRHAVRAACAIPIPLGIWLVLILQSQGVSRGALTKELAALLASALALAAAGMRLGADGGLVAAPALLGLAAASLLVGWHDDFWAIALGAAFALGVSASRDPARRPKRARRDRTGDSREAVDDSVPGHEQMPTT